MYPTDLKYTKDHEWIRIQGDTAQVGITDFAQQQLGDVVYVDLPDKGRAIKQGDVFGTIESVVTATDKAADVAASTYLGSSNHRPRRARPIATFVSAPAVRL